MGEVILLSERRSPVHRADRRTTRVQQSAPPVFFFDLACPFSYLASERLERVLGTVEWQPVPGAVFAIGGSFDERAARVAAERRAEQLRLPLVWPERYPAPAPTALRAAAYAAEQGAGVRFALAAAHLAFCGGYDLEDPEILAEAAAASGLPPDPCLAAALDERRDQGLHATATGLKLRGVRRLPAIWVGGRFRVAEAVFTERLLAPSA